MKANFLGIGVLLLMVATQFGCSNEVEVIGEWEDIPVVYGIIDLTKDTNYIRVERAYLPKSKSALEVAKDPDSLYFDPNDVVITMLAEVGGQFVPLPNPLERVDLAAEGINRDEGIFANDPAYAYRMVGHRGNAFRLQIENKKTGNTFTATTEEIRTDNAFITLKPSYNPGTKPIAFVEDKNGDIAFLSQVVDLTDNFAAIFDVGVRFYYKEYEVDASGNQVASTIQDKFVEFKARRNFVPENSNQFDVVLNGESFYAALNSNLSAVTGSNTRRCGGYIEFYVDGASTSLREYVSAVSANQGLVGGLYPADPFSNIEGGYGVLACSNRAVRTVNTLMQMSDLTYEYLADSEMTSALGFEDRTSPCY